MKVTNPGWRINGQTMSWVEKPDRAGRSVTQVWCAMHGSKRNQERQQTDIDADVDSHRKPKMKDPNSEEGDTEVH